METTKSAAIALIVFLMIPFSTIQGQKGVEDGSRYGHGEDSIRCIRNLSIYREYAKQEMYETALSSWRVVYNECPKASINIYIDGVKIFKHLLKNEEDKETKQAYLDTITNIYDKRIKYFNEKGEVLSRKGIAVLKHSAGNPERLKEGYNALKKSIQINGKNTPPAVLKGYMKVAKLMVNQEEISTDEMTNNYITVLDLINQKLEASPGNQTLLQIKNQINSTYCSSDAASCESLTEIYKPRFQKKKKDTTFLTNLTDILKENTCEETQLYYQALQQLNQMKPSAQTASEIAHLAKQKEDYNKAVDFYKKAIEQVEDKEQKATYYIKMGEIAYDNLNDNPKAEGYAEKASELDPDNGKPYILLGNIYASTENCGENKFQKKALYLLAVDMYKKAKSIDPGVTEAANNYIETYSKYFPKQETAFFQGHERGDTYKIKCWINKSTTVRIKEE